MAHCRAGDQRFLEETNIQRVSSVETPATEEDLEQIGTKPAVECRTIKRVKTASSSVAKSLSESRLARPGGTCKGCVAKPVIEEKIDDDDDILRAYQEHPAAQPEINTSPSSVAKLATCCLDALDVAKSRCQAAFVENMSHLEVAIRQCEDIWRMPTHSCSGGRKSWRSTWGAIQHKLKAAMHGICRQHSAQLSVEQIESLRLEVSLLQRKLQTKESVLQNQIEAELVALQRFLGKLTGCVATLVAWLEVLDGAVCTEIVSSEDRNARADLLEQKLDLS